MSQWIEHAVRELADDIVRARDPEHVMHEHAVDDGEHEIHDARRVARLHLFLGDPRAEIGHQGIARRDDDAPLAIEHRPEVAPADRPQLEQAADQLRALPVKVERRRHDGAQPVERMGDGLGSLDDELRERPVRLVEDRLEDRPEVREVEVQGRPLHPEGVGQLPHARLDPAGPEYLERGGGQFGSAVEIGAARHNLTECQ